MNTIAFPHLDMRCDAGVKIDDAVKDAIKNYPNYENEIKQYYPNHRNMVSNYWNMSRMLGVTKPKVYS